MHVHAPQTTRSRAGDQRLVVSRLAPGAVLTLRGRTLTQAGLNPSVTELGAYQPWREALGRLGVALGGISDAELRDLHERMGEPAGTAT